jgi:F420-non-reducing hydrogenase iron-sulfur subunit
MKVGLFISRDSGGISDVIDVDALAHAYSHLAVTNICDNFFSFPDQQTIISAVQDMALEGVVLAGNSPKYYQRMLHGDGILQAIRQSGINENRIAFANIKEQAALPHTGDPETATRKATAFIDIALSRLELCHPIDSIPVSPRRSVLVVGTTIGGLIAAHMLLERGYTVYLVEKWNRMHVQDDGPEELAPIKAAILAHEKAHIFMEADLDEFIGWCGDYAVTISHHDGFEEMAIGGVIIAVGEDKDKIEEIRKTMQLDTDKDGFFRGIYKKNSIGRTHDPGIWFIPVGQTDELFVSEAQGAGLAVTALTTLLDKQDAQHPVLTSEVDDSLCGGCGTCVKTCGFAASSIDMVEKISHIDPKRCKGCGNCVVACPTGARDLMTFPEKQIIKAIDILSRCVTTNGAPKILSILCANCGYPAADLAGMLTKQQPDTSYPSNLMPVMVECGGNVDTQYILQAFRDGFDGVAITICKDMHCHYIVGNMDLERRLGLFRDVLRSRNINDDRLRIVHVSSEDGEDFLHDMNAFSKELTAIQNA